MRFFALRTTTNPFKTHSAWLPGSGLVQIAVSSMLRLDYPPSTQLYLRSTVDTALQISRQLTRSSYNEHPYENAVLTDSLSAAFRYWLAYL